VFGRPAQGGGGKEVAFDTVDQEREVRRFLTGEAGLEDTTVGQDLRESTEGGPPLLFVDVPLRR